MSILKITYSGREIYTHEAEPPVSVWYNSGGGGPRAQLYDGDTKTLTCSGKVCTDNIRITDFNYYVNNTLTCKNKYMSSNVVMSLSKDYVHFKIFHPMALGQYFDCAATPGYTFRQWINSGEPGSEYFTSGKYLTLANELVRFAYQGDYFYLINCSLPDTRDFLTANTPIQANAEYALRSMPGRYTLILDGISSYGFEKNSAISPGGFYSDAFQSKNKGMDNSSAVMKVYFENYSTFRTYIRSYAEGNYDYTMASNTDASTYPTSYSAAKAHTRGNQKSGTSISNYTQVDYQTTDEGYHHAFFVFIKDGSAASGDDRGYVVFQSKDQEVVSFNIRQSINSSTPKYGPIVVPAGFTWADYVNGYYDGSSDYVIQSDGKIKNKSTGSYIVYYNVNGGGTPTYVRSTSPIVTLNEPNIRYCEYANIPSISFDVVSYSKTYMCPQGYTWSQFINSSLDGHADFSISSGNVYYVATGETIISPSDVWPVSGSDQIETGTYYRMP